MSASDSAGDADPLARAVDELRSGAGAPPGVVIGLSTPDGRHWRADGVAQRFDDGGELAATTAIGPQTATDLGSVTKVVGTTSALMALADAGELDLDQRLDEVLPASAGRPAGAASLEQLLGHRAGLWEWWPLYLGHPGGRGRPIDADPEAAVGAALTLPLRYPPDSGRHYSDLGFQLLGAAVAAICELELGDAVRRLVLDPWALSATGWGTPVAGAPVAASSTGDRIEREMVRSGVPYPVTGDPDTYFGWRRHVLVGEVNDGNAYHAFGGTAGHAGLFSTAGDLLDYGDTLLACVEGRGPVGAATTRRFLRAGPDPIQGLGFRRWSTTIDACTAEAVGHTGFPGVVVATLPAHRASVVLVTNRLHVPGTPRATDPMWDVALAAAHRALHG